MGQQLILGIGHRHEGRAGARRKGHERRAGQVAWLGRRHHASLDIEQGVQRGDAVRQIRTEAEHEAHRHFLRRDLAQSVRNAEAIEAAGAEQHLGFEIGRDRSDLVTPPEERQRNDGQSRAPGGEQGQRRDCRVGKLDGDAVAWSKTERREDAGKRIDAGLGLSVSEGPARPAMAPLGIGERRGIGPRRRVPPQPCIGGQFRLRRALPRLDLNGKAHGCCGRAAPVCGSALHQASS